MSNKLSAEARRVVAEVERLGPAIKRLHREIHLNPELSLQERHASEELCAFLAGEGFRIRRGLGGLPTSFRADAGSSRMRPRPALLCEYDALPGIGHGCGHSVIAAAGAGSAAALHREFPELPVTVMGTPGEEVGVGKVALIKAGAFRGIDLAMMVHPSSRRQIVRLFLGVVRRTYTYAGRPAHAAAFPEKGLNALDAVVLFYAGVSALRQQLPEQAKVHIIITDGGRMPNIIPERAEALCVMRALDLKILAGIAARIDECARGAAKATGTRLTIGKAHDLVMPLKVNRALARVYEQQALGLGLKLWREPEDKHIGSSDIGNLSQLMPVIHPHAPIARPGSVGIHTREFERAAGGPGGRAAAMEGAKLLALTALAVMKNPGAYQEIRREFQAGRQRIPRGLK